MLIITDRHTKADLKLWEEYREMDGLIKIPMEKIEQSLGIISNWLDTHKPGAVYTSWGKDSVVLLHLVSLLKIKVPVVYMRFTDRDNPDCELVRDLFLETHDMDYHEDSFEYVKVRKTGAHWKALQKKYGPYRITGIRNDESGIRKMVYLVYRESSKYSCRPLSLWRGKEIFAFIEQNGLPLCPVYGYLGGGRWERENMRTHSLAGTTGDNHGRTEWEREYYPDVLAYVKHTNAAVGKTLKEKGRDICFT
jgi:phosphoadenosine phosphosulfate reductase